MTFNTSCKTSTGFNKFLRTKFAPVDHSLIIATVFGHPTPGDKDDRFFIIIYLIGRTRLLFIAFVDFNKDMTITAELSRRYII